MSVSPAIITGEAIKRHQINQSALMWALNPSVSIPMIGMKTVLLISDTPRTS
jgi:hypothetical protein